MSRFFTVFLLLVLMAAPALAQRVSRVDFKDVKERIVDENTPLYYPALLGRLQKNDTTLSRQEYYYLYYGQVYAPAYQPYDADELSDEFRTAYEGGKFAEALALGLPELRQHPFNLKLRQDVLVCLDKADRRADALHYSKALFGFLYTIIGSGDGHSAATCFVPVAVADEYAILNYYGLTWNRQALQGTTDVFSLTGTSAPPRDERHTFTGRQIFFDASRPLAHLKEIFKK